MIFSEKASQENYNFDSDDRLIDLQRFDEWGRCFKLFIFQLKTFSQCGVSRRIVIIWLRFSQLFLYQCLLTHCLTVSRRFSRTIWWSFTMFS